MSSAGRRPTKAPDPRFRTIGILGGMGPEATAFFFDLVVRHTLASRDRDHVPIVVYNLPQTPDRTAAILRGGPSPVPDLVRGLAVLREAGADFAVMPCISAHYFYPTVSARSPLPLIHLIEEAAGAVRRPSPSWPRSMASGRGWRSGSGRPGRSAVSTRSGACAVSVGAVSRRSGGG